MTRQRLLFYGVIGLIAFSIVYGLLFSFLWDPYAARSSSTRINHPVLGVSILQPAGSRVADRVTDPGGRQGVILIDLVEQVRNTAFIHASLAIERAQNDDAVRTCMLIAKGETEGLTHTLNGKAFTEFVSTGYDKGNAYNRRSYRATDGTACYIINQVVIWKGQPDYTLKIEQKHSELWGLLDEVMRSIEIS